MHITLCDHMLLCSNRQPGGKGPMRQFDRLHHGKRGSDAPGAQPMLGTKSSAALTVIVLFF